MKQKILLLLTVVALMQNDLTAQSKKAYAVTGEKPGSINWVAFREMD